MVKTLIRIDKDVYEKIKQIAKQEDRSINGMLVYIIKKYLEKSF